MGWLLHCFWRRGHTAKSSFARPGFSTGVVVVLSMCFGALRLDAGIWPISRESQIAALQVLKSLPWESSHFVDKILQAKRHFIPVKQDQGMSTHCGFYALSHALSGFERFSPSGATLYSLALDNGWYWDDSGSTIPKNLHDTAKHLGFLKVESGWGFSGGTVSYMKALVRWGYALVVAVRGISAEGLPDYKNFFKVGGHWVAVEGFVNLQGKDYVIIKDSNTYVRQPEFIDKYLQGSHLWPVELFEKAWSFNSYVAIKPVP